MNSETGQLFSLAGPYTAMNAGHRIEPLEQMHLPGAATREAMLATGMTDGIEPSRAHLDALNPAA